VVQEYKGMNFKIEKTRPTPRSPDKCGHSPNLSGSLPQTADSAAGGFSRQIPTLPVTPTVGQRSLDAHSKGVINEEI
jgi:hypothetical protein